MGEPGPRHPALNAGRRSRVRLDVKAPIGYTARSLEPPAKAGGPADMRSSVIIEASDRLAWHQRLASEASTAAFWGGWLWMWIPFLKRVSQLVHVVMELSAWGPKVLAAAGPSLPHSLVAIAGTSGTIVAWRTLPRLRADAVAELPLSEYARRFGLEEREIEAGRRAATCVVHHHPDGRIDRIECHPPGAQAAA